MKNYKILDATNKKIFSNLDTDTQKLVKTRNKRLIDFASKLHQCFFENSDKKFPTYCDNSFYMNVRLIGNPNQPTIIFKYDHKRFFKISSFIKNFYIYFVADYNTNGVIEKFYLNENNFDKIKDKLLETLKEVEYTTLYSISYHQLVFSRIDDYGNAIFSKSNPMFFFNRNVALEQYDKLYDLGYSNLLINDIKDISFDELRK